MAGKTRAVIISHPDFDARGAAGIREAKKFAENLLQGQKQMILMAEHSGEKPEQIAKVKAHTSAYRIVIRNIDGDII